MDSADNSNQDIEAAETLRTAAAQLIAAAERLESAQSEHNENVGKPSTTTEPEPLPEASSEEEANARLVALDLATRGVDRSVAEETMAEQFPSIDGAVLLDRFYGG